MAYDISAAVAVLIITLDNSNLEEIERMKKKNELLHLICNLSGGFFH
jgi:hypothetical protein